MYDKDTIFILFWSLMIEHSQISNHYTIKLYECIDLYQKSAKNLNLYCLFKL